MSDTAHLELPMQWAFTHVLWNSSGHFFIVPLGYSTDTLPRFRSNCTLCSENLLLSKHNFLPSIALTRSRAPVKAAVTSRWAKVFTSCWVVILVVAHVRACQRGDEDAVEDKLHRQREWGFFQPQFITVLNLMAEENAPWVSEMKRRHSRFISIRFDVLDRT